MLFCLSLFIICSPEPKLKKVPEEGSEPNITQNEYPFYALNVDQLDMTLIFLTTLI
jgi:hypothetical protein